MGTSQSSPSDKSSALRKNEQPNPTNSNATTHTPPQRTTHTATNATTTTAVTSNNNAATSTMATHPVSVSTPASTSPTVILPNPPSLPHSRTPHMPSRSQSSAANLCSSGSSEVDPVQVRLELSDGSVGSIRALPISSVLEFATAVSPALLLQGTSASTFSELHSSAATSLPVPSPHSYGQHLAAATPKLHKLMPRTSSSPSMSPSSLSTVSDAIATGLSHNSFNAPMTPQTPSLLTQDTNEQKAILLRSLFQAIDKDSSGYLEREELLSWISHEPWLRQPALILESQRLLDLVSHDEDSRCSRNEFLAAFNCFTSADIITLVVNLLRAGMIARIPKRAYVYNNHDFYLNGLHRAPSIERSPDVSPDPGMHTDTSAHDTPAQTLIYGAHKSEAEKHFFLLDVLFQAMDRDLDGYLDVKDLQRWLLKDGWIHEKDNTEIFEAVDCCWRELSARNTAAGFHGSSTDELPDSTTQLSSSPSTSATAGSSSSSSNGVGPARLDRHFFFLMFSQVPKKHIRKLLVHLLSRNASSVMEDAAETRKQLLQAGSQAVSSPPNNTIAPPPGPSAPTLPPNIHCLVRKHSVILSGSKRPSVSDGLRVTLVGQSMIQADIRQSQLGLTTLSTMRPLLAADVIFTELETSLVRPGREHKAEKTRNTVFFHAATPAVLDCLVEFNFNMFATSNNHSGDLGEEGIRTIIEEFELRKLCMGGVGMDSRRAAQASFLNTPNGRIAQICFASKIPEHSIALANRAGVNSLSMIDVDNHILNPVELTRILQSIQEAHDGFLDPITAQHVPKADMIVVYHHNHYWEKNASVNQEGVMGNWKRDLAHTLIDAGAHVYIAHGDPRLQGIEIYKGSPIFYCLGNFIFQTKTDIAFYGSEVWQSVIVHLHCNDINETTSYSIKLTPIVLNERGETPENHLQTRGLPKLANRSEGEYILHKLQKLSAAFGTTISIEDTIENDPESPVIGWVLSSAVARQHSDSHAQVATSTSPDHPFTISLHRPSNATNLTDQSSAQPSPSIPVSLSIDSSSSSSSSAPLASPTLMFPPTSLLQRELSPQAAIFPD